MADVLGKHEPVCRLARLRKLFSNEDVTSIDIAFAARKLGCSRRSLQRELAQRGTSFRAELNRVRIERAKRELNTGASVTWLAYELGFGSAQSFIRGFKQCTGVTPGTWRRTAPDAPNSPDSGP
jgi:AraC-like DNA-binding protein